MNIFEELHLEHIFGLTKGYGIRKGVSLIMGAISFLYKKITKFPEFSPERILITEPKIIIFESDPFKTFEMSYTIRNLNYHKLPFHSKQIKIKHWNSVIYLGTGFIAKTLFFDGHGNTKTDFNFESECPSEMIEILKQETKGVFIEVNYFLISKTGETVSIKKVIENPVISFH